MIISDQEDITIRHAMMLTPSVLKQHMVVFQVVAHRLVQSVMLMNCVRRMLIPWTTSY